MAQSVEELLVYQKAQAAEATVSRLTRRQAFREDIRLRSALAASSEQTGSLIAEGFEQSSDRHFAQYCYRAKATCAEMRNQLRVATNREFITESERSHLHDLYIEIARMLSGLIDHLEREDRKRRRATKHAPKESDPIGKPKP
jgi:four helix bundle protein